MYNDFFGFRERPFSVTPDPRVFYISPSYQRIYDNLVHSIHEGKSLSVMTGEVGTGKTTMLRRIMRNLEDSVHFAYFTYTTLPFDDLLRFICEDLGVPLQQEGQLQTLQALQEFLLLWQNQGHTAVLLIDEAQNLQETVLEELRHLLNFTTEGKALLPVILVGQPELEKRLAQPAVYQLKQRVTLSCQLDRLKDRDIGPFIAHRLQAAACMREDIFSPEAIQCIAVHSHGIPRLINILCDNALLLGYSISEKTVSAAMIEEVSQDLGLQKPSPVLLENLVAHPEEEIVPAQTAPVVPQEKKLPQLHTSLANTSFNRTAINKGRISQRVAKANIAPTGNPSRRTSARWVALAGTGLVFALWSFTLLPYGKGGDPFAPSVPSARQNRSVSNVADNEAESLVRTELDTMPVHPDANKSRLPTVKEAPPEKKNRQEETAQMKEEKTPPVPIQSTISPSVPTDSQQASAIKELTEENPVYAPEQQPQAHALDALSSPEFILLEAASQGDVATGERLLSTGIVPDVADERGWTALMMATVHGYSPMVELLLKKSADVNRHNATGGTALMMAAIQGQNEILQLLLDKGAKVNVQDIQGWTALMYAARNGHTTTVQILLSSGAEVDLKNTNGQTALMYATARGHQETARALQDGKAGGTMFN